MPRDLGVAALQVLYLFAPLIPALMLAALVMRFDLLASLRRPIDCGRTFRGRRLLGDSKTWRGVVVAIVGCTSGAAVQKYAIGEAARPWMLVDYARLNVVLFGLAMGAGAMLGELPNSFVKRQAGIAPGKTMRGPLAMLFYVWDQVDLLTTSWPFLTFWVQPTLRLSSSLSSWRGPKSATSPVSRSRRPHRLAPRSSRRSRTRPRSANLAIPRTSSIARALDTRRL